ncbi:hypothetical protein B566_EDAN001581 [Ephemera danica]|nr:hypothetical protein B566_EDAN001581 [Ephemera danica]
MASFALYLKKKMTEGISATSARRKALTMTISALLTEHGFDVVDKLALETLVEMTQSLVTEIGASSRAYCELAGRVQPLVGDVVVALVNMGISIDGLERHARRNHRLILPALNPAAQPKQLAILQAGQKLPHPAHIPAHLPVFPDPHAYIRTPTHKQPVTEYEALREKAAAQKRDVERALTRFIAKTGDTHSLFLTDDTNLFPLVACKPQSRPYLDALLPRDQVFEEQEEEPEERRPMRREEEIPQSPPSSPPTADASSPPPPPTQPVTLDLDPIDNPYLRPVKVPRKPKTK